MIRVTVTGVEGILLSRVPERVSHLFRSLMFTAFLSSSICA